MCHNIVNGIKPGRYSKTTDKHAVDWSKAVCWGVKWSMWDVQIVHTTIWSKVSVSLIKTFLFIQENFIQVRAFGSRNSIIPITWSNYTVMRGSRNFRQGGGGVPVSLTKTALTTFLFFFFSPQLILEKSKGQYQRNLSFSRFQRGSNIFQGGGGPTFSEGVQLLIPYRNPYNLWFSRGGGGVRTPCPTPLDPHLPVKTEKYV